MSLGIGIELSTSAVRAVIIEQSGRGDAAAVALRGSSELVCDTANADALTQALTQVRTRLKITQPVVLGMPGSAAILTTVQPLVVNPRRSALAIQFELQQQLPFDLADTAWHYQWLGSTNGHGMPGSRGTPPGGPHPFSYGTEAAPSSGAVVAAMRRSLLETRLSSCRRAGLAVRAVSINPVAMVNAIQTQPGGPLAGGLAVLSIANEAMAEWILLDGAHFEVAPAASPLPALAASGGHEPISGDWLQELSASRDTIRQRVGELSNTIWVAGPQSLATQLRETWGAQTGLEVNWVNVARIVGQGANHLEQPDQWIAAVGLALQSVRRCPLPLNLIAEMRQDIWSGRVRRAAVITSGVCAAATVAFGLSGMLEVRARRARILDALEHQERLYQSLRPEAQTLLRRQQRLQERSTQLEQLLVERTLLAEALAQVVQALPDSAWLTKVEASNDGGIAGTIEGRARSFQDVTHFLDQLKAVAGMTGVKPLSTNVITDDLTKKEVIAFAAQIERKPAPPSEGGPDHAAAAENSAAAGPVKPAKSVKSAKSTKAPSAKP